MSKERNAVIRVRCCVCDKVHELKVVEEDAMEYFSPNRRFIQDLFPYLTPSERELLVSNMCGECWDKMFGFEDDEEEDEEDFSQYEESLRQTEVSCEELKEVF